MKFKNIKTGNVINVHERLMPILKFVIRSDEYVFINDDFKEHEHPRDPSGKFTSGGGGGGASVEPTKTEKPSLELLKAYNKGLKEMPGSPKQKETLQEIEKLRSSEPAPTEKLAEKKGRGFEKGGVDKHGFERSPGLTPKQRRVEGTFYNAIRTNQQQLISDYWQAMKKEKFFNTIDADQVKKLSPAFRKDMSMVGAVHEPSSHLSKVIYKQALEKKARENDKSPTMFTAGGSGSGKSATSPLAASMFGLKDDNLVYDSVMSTFKSSKRKVDEALDMTEGDAVIVYTNTPIERALKFNAMRSRSVSIDVLIEAHMGASKTVHEMHEHYKDNPRVKMQIINNFDEPHNVHLGTLEGVFKYDPAVIRQKLERQAKEMFAKGEIGKDKLKTLLG